MSQKFKFNILTGEDAPDKYAAIDPKEPFTFYLLQTGAGYLGTVKLFDASDSSVMSGKFFRAVSSHVITQADLDNENVNAPSGTKVGDVGMLFTSDSDQDDNGNETFYFLPVQFKEIETIDEIDPDDPGDKIPTAIAVVNYVIKMLEDKVSFEIDGVPGGSGDNNIGSSGNTGSIDNPIGTIISFMGTSAPKDYLICDGAEYNIEDYPDLANHFISHFGSVDYFGGNGTTTFAVPDLRNLFLRGYRGEAEEQLSGQIGKKQEATRFPRSLNIGQNSNSLIVSYSKNDNKPNDAFHKDSLLRADDCWRFENPQTAGQYSVNDEYAYTSRPVNMAVLFCIRAIKPIEVANTKNNLNVYSLEETIVGKWINGKPIYQITFETTAPGSFQGLILPRSDIDDLIMARATLRNINSLYGNNYIVPSDVATFGTSNNGIVMVLSNSALYNKQGIFTVQYTKTTDNPT